MSTFKIEIVVMDRETEISESDIVEYAEKRPESFGNYLNIEGRVTFVIGDERIEIEDTLSYVLPTLALEALPELASEGQFELILDTTPEDFNFVSDGTTVRMSGNYMDQELEFRHDDMIATSIEACRRFMTWAEKIWPGIGIADQLAELDAVQSELAAPD